MVVGEILMKIRSLVLFLAFACASLTAFPTSALACACCADRGFYSISYQQPGTYLRDEIAKIKFAPTANLFLGGAGEDSVKGILSVAETYKLLGKFAPASWEMTFTTGTKTGVLTLPLPDKVLSYKVDTHENEESRGDVTLYKELRFAGTTSGTGIFQAGIVAPTKYFLVLQGRGNLCDSAPDYTHWRLEITGKKASYAFFGKLTNSRKL